MTAQVTMAMQTVSQHTKSRGQIALFMSQNDISIELGKQILLYVKRRKPVHPWMRLDGVESLKHLPDQLMLQLHFEVYSPILGTHPMWAQLLDSHPTGVAKVCCQAVSEVSMKAGDALFHQGVLATKMFFVRKVHDSGDEALMYYPAEDGKEHGQNTHDTSTQGRMSVLEDHVVHYHVYLKHGISIRKGEWFGEHALWLVQDVCTAGKEVPVLHHGSALAIEACELMAIDAIKFRGILPEHPSLLQELQPYAKRFATTIQGAVACVDLWGKADEIKALLHEPFLNL